MFRFPELYGVGEANIKLMVQFPLDTGILDHLYIKATFTKKKK